MLVQALRFLINGVLSPFDVRIVRQPSLERLEETLRDQNRKLRLAEAERDDLRQTVHKIRLKLDRGKKLRRELKANLKLLNRRNEFLEQELRKAVSAELDRLFEQASSLKCG